MLKNSYSFVSRFFKLLNVRFYHNFFKDNFLKGLTFLADNETNSLLNNYGILFRPIENGFTLISKTDPKFESISFAEELKLNFYFKINNPDFINITDIPFTNSQKLLFKNTQDQTNEKLHSGFFVDESNVVSSDDEGIIGQVLLTINSKNQFFGSNLASGKKNELNYSVQFNSRQIKFRYNFLSSKEDILDFDSYYITNEQNSIRLKEYKTRVLANGSNVFYFIIDQKKIAAERYKDKLYLKKEDDFLTYFSVFLPFPKPMNISYDEKEKVFLNDVYIKI
jgi:hypothetical protein